MLAQVLGVPAEPASDPAALSARVADPGRVVHALAALARADIALTSFSLGQPSLDEVFLALTGRPTQQETDTTEEGVA